MFKLRNTWTVIFQNDMLYDLDSQVRLIDPAWPLIAKRPVAAPAQTNVQPEVTAPDAEDAPLAPTSIHVNPRFLVKVSFLIGQQKI